MKKTVLLLLSCVWIFCQSQAQSTQIIRGTIIDKQSEQPLIGVNVVVKNLKNPLVAQTDVEGNYAVKNVPPGRYDVAISYLGYNTMTLPNIVVTAGKETILNMVMEESVTSLKEVVIKGDKDKSQTINDLATISARQFNVEQVQRFSGGRNDIARLASNFAGVATANDSRNDIVIRGNSPTGVLWRMEGIPIPSPNHFATLGTTGGPVSALNPNLIRNSDFLTSAFPAEYGNALAGVFDIGLRTGNREKFEVTAQLAAFSGMEAMIEGPFNKKKGSFLVAYRHSFVELAHLAGLNIGTTAVPRYKDLSFNLDFGLTKLGKISIFGIGGLSNVDLIGAKLNENDFFAEKDVDAFSVSKFGVVGLKHSVILNTSSYIRTVISAANTNVVFNTYKDYQNEIKRHNLKVGDTVATYSLSSFYNKKFNAKWSLRTGILLQNMGIKSLVRSRQLTPDWVTFRSFEGNAIIAEAYLQTQYKPTNRLTLNGGLHTQYLNLSKEVVLEPRFALNYQIGKGQTLNFGYGLHHQAQPLPVFFQKQIQPDGSYNTSNSQLKFSRSNQLVVGYDAKIGEAWHTKLEVYYQFLDKIGVQNKATSFSMLNTGADFAFPQTGALLNAGTGKNKGVELTVEKFFSQGWYTFISASLFDSQYKGSDNIERNTAFAGRYVANILGGKEFKFGKNKTNAFTIDTKLTLAGGRPFTPIDTIASALYKTEIRLENQAYSQYLSNYFRWDVKIGYTLNSSKRHFSQQFFMDFQNVTNHKNIFQQRYSVERNTLYNVYQMGFIPDILWRVQF
jgi:CarboxypepD_reg-like domain/TonB-dependent Receptor Plug Domain